MNEFIIIVYSLCGTPQMIATVEGDLINVYKATLEVASQLVIGHPDLKSATVKLEELDQKSNCA